MEKIPYPDNYQDPYCDEPELFCDECGLPIEDDDYHSEMEKDIEKRYHELCCPGCKKYWAPDEVGNT